MRYTRKRQTHLDTGISSPIPYEDTLIWLRLYHRSSGRWEFYGWIRPTPEATRQITLDNQKCDRPWYRYIPPGAELLFPFPPEVCQEMMNRLEPHL